MGFDNNTSGESVKTLLLLSSLLRNIPPSQDRAGEGEREGGGVVYVTDNDMFQRVVCWCRGSGSI
jgi:hypothetical protein